MRVKIHHQQISLQLQQPTLDATGWSDKNLKEADAIEITAGLLFVQLLCLREFEKAAAMAEDPSKKDSWNKGFNLVLGDTLDSPVEVCPDPVSYQKKTAEIPAWVYVPLLVKESDMSEAVTLNIHVQTAVGPGGREYYDLSPLRCYDWFPVIENLRVPNSYKLEVVEWGRP